MYMPNRKRGRRSQAAVSRRRVKRYHKRVYKRNAQKSMMVMVNRAPPALKYPVPPTFRTTFTLDRVFDTSTDTLTHGSTGYCDIAANYSRAAGSTSVFVSLPSGSGVVNSGTWYGGGAGSVVEGNYIDSGSGSTLSNCDYAGLDRIFLNGNACLYNVELIKASRITATLYVSTANGADVPVQFCIVPWRYDKSTASPIFPPQYITDAAQQPRSKYALFGGTTAGKRLNSVSNYCTTHGLFGVPKGALSDNLTDWSYSALANTATFVYPRYQWFWRLIWAIPADFDGVFSFTTRIQLKAYTNLLSSSNYFPTS